MEKRNCILFFAYKLHKFIVVLVGSLAWVLLPGGPALASLKAFLYSSLQWVCAGGAVSAEIVLTSGAKKDAFS